MRIYVSRTLFLLMVFCFFGREAVSAIDVGLDFKSQKMFGHTKFRIEFTEYFPPAQAMVKGESELEFPLDVFLVGADLRVEGKIKTGELWSVNLGASKSINDPSGYVKDSDWIGLPEYNWREKFSFTESDAELKALLAYVEGRFGLVTKPNFILELLGGYEFQDFSFEVFGIRGWQGFQQDITHFDTLQGMNVGDYDVEYHIPYFGIAIYAKVLSQLSLEAKGSFSPQVRANDHDDHILRNKTLDGKCNGNAFKVGSHLRFILFKSSNKSNWFLGAGLNFMKIDTKGKQDQFWYGDDPATPDEDDTGAKETGIKQKVNSEQIIIQAQMGYQF
jgi:outer membrane protease